MKTRPLSCWAALFKELVLLLLNVLYSNYTYFRKGFIDNERYI